VVELLITLQSQVAVEEEEQMLMILVEAELVDLKHLQVQYYLDLIQ
jgi:hypothetical protein